MTVLVIFATSQRPDAYVNAVTYGVQHLNVESLRVAVIAEVDDARGDVIRRASDILSSIMTRLEELAAKGLGGSRLEPNVYGQTLSHLREVASMGLEREVLHEQLSALRKHDRCIFDVTALRKDLLVDVTSLALADGFSDVFTFELRKQPTFDDRDLLHRLQVGTDYVYRNLSESTPVRLAKRRVLARSVRFRNIVVVTAVLMAAVVVTQLTAPRSWLMTGLILGSVVSSIGSWLALFMRD